MSISNLYFIAVIPGQQLQERVIEIERDFARRFDSRRALKVMPHITLKAPFRLPVSLHDHFLNWFDHLKLPDTPFVVTLKGFGAFNNKEKPVVFVNPVANASLALLQSEIINAFRTVAPRLVHPADKNFNPHMTIAYRDLTPDNFESAWKEYQDKEFEDQFTINAVHLLQHDQTKWNLISSRPLGNS